MNLLKFLNSIFNQVSEPPVVTTPSILRVSDLNEAEKLVLKVQYEKFSEQLSSESRIGYEKACKNAEALNSKCPKCGSEHVNNRIKRTQGEIKGSSSIYGSSFLGTGYTEGYGSIKGSIDTNPVNKCNDCQHEWQIKEVKWNDSRTSLKDIAVYIGYLACEINKAYKEKVKFDPNDLKEIYASREEKRQALINELPNCIWVSTLRKRFNNYSIELIRYIIEDELGNSNSWREDWKKCDKEKFAKLLNLPSIRKQEETK